MPPHKRVLLTLEALDMQGVTFSTLNLISGLLRQGTRVQVIAARSGERERDFRDKGVEVVIARHFGRPLLGRGAVVAVRNFQPTVVHAQSTAIGGRSLTLAKSIQVPLVVTANRLEDSDNDFLSAHREVGVISVSDAIRERLTNRGGIERDRIRVIPNGLDMTHFPPPDLDEETVSGRALVVGTYGKLAEEKGQRVFLEAAATILQSGVDVEFLILGRGPDKPELRRIAKRLGLTSRLTFSPTTTSRFRSMGSMDIFVEPSFQEGLGLSVMQAMASGIPVIASGVGGIYNLIADGETGVLVPSGDAEALARAVADLLAAPTLRRELARHARERVEKEFNADSIASRVLEWYQDWGETQDAETTLRKPLG